MCISLMQELDVRHHLTAMFLETEQEVVSAVERNVLVSWFTSSISCVSCGVWLRNVRLFVTQHQLSHILSD